MPTPSSDSPDSLLIAIVGGGPAGFMAAIAARETDPACEVTIFEKSAHVLGKVKISGGGRCNITHDCDDVRQLADNYPRGQRELIGPFTRFGIGETMAWFTGRGVPLHTYPDGCIFPESNSSETVIACLTGEARRLGVDVRLRAPVTGITQQEGGFVLETPDGPFAADRVLIATGGKAVAPDDHGPYTPSGGYALAASLGHGIITPVPSLFTFTVKDPLIADLPGIVVDPVRIRSRLLKGVSPQEGPLLITHWGISGPAVLQLSAWGAPVFHEADYAFPVVVDWLPQQDAEELEQTIEAQQQAHPAKSITASGLLGLSRRLWERLVAAAGIPAERCWGELGRKQRAALICALKATELAVSGQSTFKDEFVTCGGVSLKEVDLRTMQSRLVPGLYFAGEVLDIDGVTGGFNFQACWTTGHLAGLAMVSEMGKN